MPRVTQKKNIFKFKFELLYKSSKPKSKAALVKTSKSSQDYLSLKIMYKKYLNVINYLPQITKHSLLTNRERKTNIDQIFIDSVIPLDQHMTLG